MAAAKLACPVCALPAFPSVHEMRGELVSVATRRLACPVCPDVLLGLDKFTLHLFGHAQPPPPPPPPPPRCEACGLECADAGPPQLPCQLAHSSPSPPAADTPCRAPGPPAQETPSQPEGQRTPPGVQPNPEGSCSVESTQAPSAQGSLNFTFVAPSAASGDGKQTGFACHLCAKVFKMRGSLMVHMRVVHSGISAGKLLRNWVQSSQHHQKQHLPQDSENLSFTCTVCSKSFKKEQQLNQHQRSHEGKQWACDECGKLFTTKYFLKKHKRLHTGEMPYSCPTCNKTFTFQQSYHKHLLYHSDEKPHVCTECDRAFKELSTLHNHQRIHTGEKPFACETCGKCFRQRVSYLVHRRIHTGAMPYRCTACDKSFRYKVSQRTHKCPAQPPGMVVRQTGDLVQRLLQTAQQRARQQPTTVHAAPQNQLQSSRAQHHTNDPQYIHQSQNYMETESHQVYQLQLQTNENGSHQMKFGSGSGTEMQGVLNKMEEINTQEMHRGQKKSVECKNAKMDCLIKETFQNKLGQQEQVTQQGTGQFIVFLEGNTSSVLLAPPLFVVPQQPTPSWSTPDNLQSTRSSDVWIGTDISSSQQEHLESRDQRPVVSSTNLGTPPTDFFAMVMSPPPSLAASSGLPSPSESLQQLTLSTVEEQITAGSGSNTEERLCNAHSPSPSSALQTINEESLKQLLYGSII